MTAFSAPSSARRRHASTKSVSNEPRSATGARQRGGRDAGGPAAATRPPPTMEPTEQVSSKEPPVGGDDRLLLGYDCRSAGRRSPWFEGLMCCHHSRAARQAASRNRRNAARGTRSPRGEPGLSAWPRGGCALLRLGRGVGHGAYPSTCAAVCQLVIGVFGEDRHGDRHASGSAIGSAEDSPNQRGWVRRPAAGRYTAHPRRQRRDFGGRAQRSRAVQSGVGEAVQLAGIDAGHRPRVAQAVRSATYNPGW